jgi:hypothetical protein
MKKGSRCLSAGLCSTVIAGCYQKVSENGSLTFTFQPWLPLLVALVGIAAVPVGIMLLVRRRRFWGICLLIVGPLAAAAVAPGMYLDKVVVNEEGFYSRHGFWWNSTIHQIRYEELSLVRVGFEERIGRRGKTYSYYFDCTFKSGKPQERVPLGDIMREALPEIAEQFRKHGVPVQIPSNLPN